jgi:hypothetical protein
MLELKQRHLVFILPIRLEDEVSLIIEVNMDVWRASWVVSTDILLKIWEPHCMICVRRTKRNPERGIFLALFDMPRATKCNVYA